MEGSENEFIVNIDYSAWSLAGESNKSTSSYVGR